ncbi:MAG: cupin domain-containing protein [Planctomycetota bacterium]
MAEILLERVERSKLQEMKVFSWPIWECEPATFDWYYSDREVCYILEGRARIEPTGGGEPVEIGPGDLVTFPADLSCVWTVIEPIRKHYHLG